MTVAKPQNREEFKQNIKIRLGAPVLEINVLTNRWTSVSKKHSNTSTREVTMTVMREYISLSILTVPMSVQNFSS